MKRENYIRKIFIIAVMFFVLIHLMTNISFACGDIISKSNDFVKPEGDVPITVEQAATDLEVVTNVLFTIATVVVVVSGLILGVKYMMSEPNDKSKIKEKIIWYFIAIALVYGGIGIADIVSNFFVQNIK